MANEQISDIFGCSMYRREMDVLKIQQGIETFGVGGKFKYTHTICHKKIVRKNQWRLLHTGFTRKHKKKVKPNRAQPGAKVIFWKNNGRNGGMVSSTLKNKKLTQILKNFHNGLKFLIEFTSFHTQMTKKSNDADSCVL